MSLKVLKIPNINSLVIKQDNVNEFFTLANDGKGIIITIFNLSSLLKFLVFREFISPKVLQQIVDEYNSYQKGE